MQTSRQHPPSPLPSFLPSSLAFLQRRIMMNDDHEIVGQIGKYPRKPAQIDNANTRKNGDVYRVWKNDGCFLKQRRHKCRTIFLNSRQNYNVEF